jgi:Uma2 family endonuclease
MHSSAPDLDAAQYQHLVLDDVSWGFYDHFLEETRNRRLRIAFDNGRLEIAERSCKNESWKCLIRQLIQVACLEREIDLIPAGAPTLRSETKQKGLAPDECYYLSDGLMTARDIDESAPPDLVLDVNVISPWVNRQSVFAAFHVPELWWFDRGGLTILTLNDRHEYEQQQSSGLFPFLAAEQLNQFINRFEDERNVSVVSEFGGWIRRLP